MSRLSRYVRRRAAPYVARVNRTRARVQRAGRAINRFATSDTGLAIGSAAASALGAAVGIPPSATGAAFGMVSSGVRARRGRRRYIPPTLDEWGGDLEADLNDRQVQQDDAHSTEGGAPDSGFLSPRVSQFVGSRWGGFFSNGPRRPVEAREAGEEALDAWTF